MTERAVPFHCPYCGDENLWPHEGASVAGAQDDPPRSRAATAGWECRSCLRAFTVSMIGQIARPGGRS